MTDIAVVAGVLLVIGFISGYAVRELISRLRRTKARRRHFERQREEVTRTRKLIAAQPAERLAIGFQISGRGDAPPKEGAP